MTQVSRFIFDEPSESFTVGVIGAGHVAEKFHLPILSNLDNVSLAYVADIDRNRVNRLADRYDTESLVIEDASSLPRSDGVLLAIPVGFRKEYIEKLGDRGTAIFAEKPFAIDTSMHDRFENTVDPIVCNYMRTLYGSLRQVRDVLESEMFGSLSKVEVTQESVGATGKGKGHYQTDPEKGGGLLLEKGVHTLSQLVMLFDAWNWSVASSEMYRENGLNVDISARFHLERNNQTVSLSYRLSGIKPVGTTMRFQFEQGEVRMDPADPSKPIEVGAPGQKFPRFQTTVREDMPTSNHQAMYLRWKQFIALAEGRTKEAIPLPTGRKVTELIEEIVAAEGR